MRGPSRSIGRGAPLLIAFVLVGALAAPAMAAGSFIDDDNNLHEPAIEAIVEDGITLGCGDFSYCPTIAVTRGQMASFLARAFDLPATTTDYFNDDVGAHEDNINRVAAAGITSGFPDGTYQPDGRVSREQLASFLGRALGLTPVDGDAFVDVSGVHAGNVYAVAEAGITLGCNSDGTEFCPNASVRRDQMASFLARALDLPLEPAPEVTYDDDWEACVWDGIQTASVAVGEASAVRHAAQTVIARQNAVDMQALGQDWSNHELEPEYLTAQILAELGLTDDATFVSEGVTQGLNVTCETMVERTAPTSASNNPTHRYVGIGTVVDPVTGWVYQSVIQIRISEL